MDELGAREPAVDEPSLAAKFDLTTFRAILPIIFDEIAEPKALQAADLQDMKIRIGSYMQAARCIGASKTEDPEEKA